MSSSSGDILITATTYTGYRKNSIKSVNLAFPTKSLAPAVPGLGLKSWISGSALIFYLRLGRSGAQP